MKNNNNTADRRVAELGKMDGADGHLLPNLPAIFIARSTSPATATIRLTGISVRRRPGRTEQIVWDRDLPGFGLRIRPTGYKTWIVQHRRRGKTVKVMG